MNRKYLEKWLKDAYAMERSGASEMEKQLRDFDEYPEIRERIERHLEETKEHAAEIAQCLSILGYKVPAIRDAVIKALAGIAVVTNPMGEDRVLKNLLMNAALERLEIAAYSSLIVAAEECGESVIFSACNRILKQEQETERWYEDLIPVVAGSFITTREASAA
jgi:ferritin-like metal-binding protein YciE